MDAIGDYSHCCHCSCNDVNFIGKSLDFNISISKHFDFFPIRFRF